jgi:hypothetical protein
MRITTALPLTFLNLFRPFMALERTLELTWLTFPQCSTFVPLSDPGGERDYGLASFSPGALTRQSIGKSAR